MKWLSGRDRDAEAKCELVAMQQVLEKHTSVQCCSYLAIVIAGLQGSKALLKRVKEAWGWLWPLLVLMSGYAVWKAAFLTYTQTVPQALKSCNDPRW